MHLHRFAINEAARHPKPGQWVNWRGFVSLWDNPDNGKSLGGAHTQIVLRAPQPEASVRFHVGTSGSESPWDGHLTILGSGIYWGIEAGHRLADRLTKCPEHRWEGRDLSLSIYRGRLSIHAWIHDGHWTRGEFAPWREGSYAINPLTRLFGSPRYWYVDHATAELDIDLPEGTYPVVATLQLQQFGRPKLKRRVESWVVNVKAPKGIPNRYDPSGGWKGDRVYGFAVKLPHRRPDWSRDAKALITARILEDRGRTGFRKAQAQETS